MYLDSEEKTVSNEVPRWHQFLLGEVTEKQCWCLELGKRGTQMQAQNSCDAVWSSGERWGKRQNCFREGKTKGVNAKHKEMQQQFSDKGLQQVVALKLPKGANGIFFMKKIELMNDKTEGLPHPSQRKVSMKLHTEQNPRWYPGELGKFLSC